MSMKFVFHIYPANNFVIFIIISSLFTKQTHVHTRTHTLTCKYTNLNENECAKIMNKVIMYVYIHAYIHAHTHTSVNRTQHARRSSSVRGK